MPRVRFKLATVFLAMTWIAIACVVWPASAWLKDCIPSIAPNTARMICGSVPLFLAIGFGCYRGVTALLKIRDMDL